MVFPVKVLDTSFIVSLFLLQDANHQLAEDLIQKNLEEQLLLPEPILQETLTVILYKNGIEKCREVYDRLIHNKQIDLVRFNQNETEDILQMFLGQKTKLSIQDISVIYLSKKSASEALTFDNGIINNLKG